LRGKRECRRHPTSYPLHVLKMAPFRVAFALVPLQLG